MIGQTISHYRILERLGEGGMGIVYKALDTRLDRLVALKFLPPQYTEDANAKERFIHEAKAASALDHANICNIHEIDEASDGRLFIVMSCYDGESIKAKIERGPLPVEEAIDYAIQIAKGLSKAHKKGFVHRDIKPANLLVTDDGIVKIVDFGLVKLSGATSLTKSGSTVGTVAYMSPEQARSEKVDHRTDIWSLGVVLYEMLSGHRPFPGDYEAAVIYSILNSEPEKIIRHNTAASAFQPLLDRALEKDIDSRYQSVDDVIADLKRLQESPETSLVGKSTEVGRKRRFTLITAVIILFLTAGYGIYSRFLASPNSNETDSLTMAFEQEPFVVVITPFWGSNEEALEEGNVMQALVERAVREELGQDKNVRIIGREVKDVPRSHEEAMTLGKRHEATVVIWGEVIILQGEIEIQPYLTVSKPLAIVGEDKTLSPGELTATTTTPDQIALRRVKAEDLGNMAMLLAGRYYSRTEPEKAVSILDRVKPPTSESLRLKGHVFLISKEYQNAEELYEQAVVLDSSNVDASIALGNVYNVQGKTEEALREYERTRAQNSNHPHLLGQLALTMVTLGNEEDGLALLENAISHDPNNLTLLTYLGQIYGRLDRRDEAISAFKLALRLNPEYAIAYTYLGNWYLHEDSLDLAVHFFQEAIRYGVGYISLGYLYDVLGQTYARQSNYDEAIAAYQSAIALSPRLESTYSNLSNIYLQQNRLEETIVLYNYAIETFPDNVPFYIGLMKVYQSQGNHDKVIELCKEILRLDPENRDAFYNLGYTYASSDSLDLAAYYAQESIRVSNESTTNWDSFLSHLLLAQILFIQEKYDDALTPFQQAIAINPANSQAHIHFARAYIKLGDHENAIVLLQKAATLATYTGEFVFISNCYNMLGMFEAQASALNRALDLGAQDLGYKLYYFFSLYRAGKLAEAQDYIKKIGETIEDNSLIAAVIRFVSGTLDEESLLQLINGSELDTEKTQLSQAYYFLGLAYLLNVGDLVSAAPDTAKAITYFEKGVATYKPTQLAFSLSEIELERLSISQNAEVN